MPDFRYNMNKLRLFERSFIPKSEIVYVKYWFNLATHQREIMRMFIRQFFMKRGFSALNFAIGKNKRSLSLCLSVIKNKKQKKPK